MRRNTDTAGISRRFLAYLLHERPLAKRLVITLGLMILSVALNIYSVKAGWGQLYSAVLGAAVLSAIYAGTRLGLLAGLCGALALDYLVIEPGAVFATTNSILRLLLYFIIVLPVGLAFTELRTGYKKIEEAERKANQARQEAERASLARQQLIGTVSHDLRNPLASLDMNIELIRRNPQDLSAVLALLRSMSRSTGRMSRIINDLLDAATIDSGNFSIQLAPQRLDRLVNAVLEYFRPVAAEKRLTLAAKIDTVDPQLVCDRHRMIQAISKLVQNAIQVSNPGGHIQVSVSEAKDVVEFRVSDEGPGIAAVEIPSLFERRWHAKSSAGGAGLGLYIAQGIVRSHGGSLVVHSKPESGATFVISIPRRAVVEDRRIAQAAG